MSQTVMFCGDLSNFNNKIYGTLKCFLTRDHMGLEISKRYSYSFQPTLAKPHEDIAYHRGIRAVTLFGMFKNLWHFDILTWKSMGQS